MSKDPAFLFYPNDYLGGTMGFSFKQHGAYLMLLIFQFNNGPFKKETAIGMVGEELFNSICHKFEEKDGCICNARLMQEITRRKEYSQNRRENAKNGWKKRKNNSISNESAKHMQSTCNDPALHMGNETRNRTRAINKDEIENKKKEKPKKHKYGEYKHVLLTEEEYRRLVDEFGISEANDMIKNLDEGIEMKGYKYKNHNLVLRKWRKNGSQTNNKPVNRSGFVKSKTEYDEPVRKVPILTFD